MGLEGMQPREDSFEGESDSLRREQIGQYINCQPDKKEALISQILVVLETNDGEDIELINHSDQAAYTYEWLVKIMRGNVDDGTINPNAPWFAQLQDKLMRLELYVAGTHRDTEKGSRRPANKKPKKGRT